eukprot:TRINITY_DN44423_c0_g1_i1.p1 TRINITY_DN44423_c0_g1~~TRINITY_DN44423_c0_g1_i1.p1  ORF type:complete len:213 (-),score=75.90 TRINITY_DN44423_c0_g1_i1:123-722(-)
MDIRQLAQLLPMEEKFLMMFRINHPLDSSVEFMKVWYRFDTNCNGFIEEEELRDFLSFLLQTNEASKDVTDEELAEYTEVILKIFDVNNDGVLHLSEMGKLLPVKENFLNSQIFLGSDELTEDDIANTFTFYDRDCNGVIENEELKGFLKDLLELARKEYDESDLNELHQVIMQTCDLNNDGKISKQELNMILLTLSSQ